MFRFAIASLAGRVAEVIDDMLLGDYEYVLADGRLYADVDYLNALEAEELRERAGEYFRTHPHHSSELTWTPSAGRGFGPQRTVLAGPAERRAGTVPARAGACDAPARTPLAWAHTAAGARRSAH